jgi:hypothetical protein
MITRLTTPAFSICAEVHVPVPLNVYRHRADLIQEFGRGLRGAFCDAGGALPSADRDDDHLRHAIGLRACGNECAGTVKAGLTAIFRRYGLPERMLMDNGSPWG